MEEALALVNEQTRIAITNNISPNAMASSPQQQRPTDETGILGTTRRKDPLWMAQLAVIRQTSSWRDYYASACRAAGFPQAADHLFLTCSFKPHSASESTAAYKSIIANEASQEDSKVMILALSYDHDETGHLTDATWSRVLRLLRQVVDPPVSVQLWVDRVDSENRSGSWGIRQLLPYVMFPVVRVGSRPDAGFWSNMEGLAGIFGRGLYHDKSLDVLVVQDYAPAAERDFFVSRAATWNAGDAVATFYVHLMFGCLTKYRNLHQEALRKLSMGAILINFLLVDPNVYIELITGHERNSMYGDGRFEIMNGFRCRTDIPSWHGLKEWITLDRYIHAVPSLNQPFRIKGFVNVYFGNEKTVAIVHWALKTGWTRRLLVELTQGSREEGNALTHLRLAGYRQTRQTEVLESERSACSSAMPHLYRFDSFNIRWT